MTASNVLFFNDIWSGYSLGRAYTRVDCKTSTEWAAGQGLLQCTSAKDGNLNDFTNSKKQDKELHYLTARKSKILQPFEDPPGTLKEQTFNMIWG